MAAARRRAALGALIAAAALALAAGPPVGVPRAAGAECSGDECQAVPPAPDDPTPGSAIAEGPPNPPVHFPKQGKHKKKHRKHHHGKKRHHPRAHSHQGHR